MTVAIRLVDVYQGGRVPQRCVDYLYKLLQERPPEANISHREMPSRWKHRQFVHRRPYEAWFLIEGTPPIGLVGAIYLSKAREVGIFISPSFQGKGYGRAAVEELRRLYPGRMIANVAPGNERSHAFFKVLGGRVIQHTYELP